MSEKKNMQGGVFTIDAINLVNQEGESVDIQNSVLIIIGNIIGKNIEINYPLILNTE